MARIVIGLQINAEASKHGFDIRLASVRRAACPERFVS
jgi:hypothetical protein